MIIGAIFGGVTLIVLFGYALIAGLGHTRFICDSFQLLAAGFSLGCAFSAAFLGGGAAAQGTFGGAVQNKSLAFSLTGGVAVLIIAFFAFSAFQPVSCKVASLEEKIIQLEGQLKVYAERDLRITPEAYNQPRLLADEVQLHYINRDREDVTLTPHQGQGVFVIKMKDIDEGSTITIGPRPSAEVARPIGNVDTNTPILEPTPVELSSMKYLSMPTYFEIQLFLKLGNR